MGDIERTNHRGSICNPRRLRISAARCSCASVDDAEAMRPAKKNILGNGSETHELDLPDGYDAYRLRFGRVLNATGPWSLYDARVPSVAPVTILMSVDLPAPFSPTSAWISPAFSSKSTPQSARRKNFSLCPSCVDSSSRLIHRPYLVFVLICPRSPSPRTIVIFFVHCRGLDIFSLF